ncbi:uncharacterized protein LOC119183243 [Rhipicephalus microplus]|uniref:uncharacterized protein LOC119183243 n=1 Tax=Rhipicephalus microplus TaxID=6941 RepID=UPI003F6B2EFF
MTVMVWVMLLLAQAAVAIVCPPHVCESTKCPRLPVKTYHGRLSTQGSFCGCCKVCIQESGIGNPCVPSGLCPGPSECKESLYCDPDQRACLPFPMPPSEEIRGYNDTLHSILLGPAQKEPRKPNPVGTVKVMNNA